jgi:hypothetical protein
LADSPDLLEVAILKQELGKPVAHRRQMT